MANANPKQHAPVNTRQELAEMQANKKALRQIYASEPQIAMYLSPMYRPYFGNVMNVKLNGLVICFPVNGGSYKVPKSFADEITRRRMCVDNMLTKQNRMANVQDNHEAVPGELSMF